MSGTRRLAFFGGTFDPPHLGHLIVAGDVVEALELDALFFLLAGVPPHKQDEVTAPAETRLEMLEAAVTGDPRLAVSGLELERPGPSYTVDTLAELAERVPGDEIHFVMGTDQLAGLDTWKEPERVARLARLVVITRAGADPAPESPVDVPFQVVPVTRIDLSSTEIRGRVRDGRSIRYLVPEPVRRIIERESLYHR